MLFTIQDFEFTITHMIHVITKGGMGNQMFQYAYALQLRKVNHPKELILLNGALHRFYPSNRKLNLHHFKLDPRTRQCSVFRACWLTGRYILRTIATCGIKVFVNLVKRNRVISTEDEMALLNNGLYFTSDAYHMPIPKKTHGIKHLNSFFQDAKILDGIYDELIESFSIITPPSSANQQLIEEINACNAVCLHIRRGDYLTLPQFQVCDSSYYTNAVQKACETLDSPVFYCFSTGKEDIKWIKDNYRFNADVRYVDLENPDYEELRLMMTCKHFIISNSTFSWWAAVLSKASIYEPKKVWAPKVWYHGSDARMALPSWNLI